MTPTPTPDALQQIIETQLSSPVWWFSAVVVAILINVITGLLVPRLDQHVLGRFFASRRARLDRLEEYRRRLTAALLNRPHLQQLVAQRITVLRGDEGACVLMATTLAIALVVGRYFISKLLDPAEIANNPDTAAFVLGFAALVVGLMIVGLMTAVSRVKKTRIDLQRALADALAHDGEATELLALDEERRAARCVPYLLETPPTADAHQDNP